MNRQLTSIADELREALVRVRRLAAVTTPEEWGRRPQEGSWSIDECIAHLNMTSEASIPPIREAVERLEVRRGEAPERYRRDLLGWLIWRSQKEGVKMRTKTSAAFVPSGSDSTPESSLSRFEELQEELLNLVARGEGLPLTAEKIRSPFNAKVSYNVFSALSIVAVHQHRHLGQAERAGGAISR
jgi:hypothetical protein